MIKTYVTAISGDESLTENSWKEFRNQSERQYGAFILMFATINKSMPLVLSSKDKKFRNSVILKGHICTKEEALDFSDKIYDIIAGYLKILRIAHVEAEAKYRRYLNKIREMKRRQDISYTNWEPIGYITSKENDPGLTFEKVVSGKYVI